MKLRYRYHVDTPFSGRICISYFQRICIPLAFFGVNCVNELLLFSNTRHDYRILTSLRIGIMFKFKRHRKDPNQKHAEEVPKDVSPSHSQMNIERRQRMASHTVSS